MNDYHCHRTVASQTHTKKPTIWKFLSPRFWIGFLTHLVREGDARLFGVDYRRYHQILRQRVLDGGCNSLLDVGCGENSPVSRFAAEISYRVGVDAHLQSIEKSRIAGIHSEYVVKDILEIGESFQTCSFDCVTLLEVIEHLPRAEGERLLEQCERIARLKVVVSTPNGFVLQHPEPDNPFQEHLSGWSAEDFRSRGYEVTGVAGWKCFRGSLMRPKWRPHSIFGRLSLITEAWFEDRPDQAFQILCVKELSQSDEVDSR